MTTDSETWDEDQEARLREEQAARFRRDYAVLRSQIARERRERLAAEHKCINGDTHALPAPGDIRCNWCKEVHRRGVKAVLADPNAPPRPPNYRVRRAPLGVAPTV